MLPILVRTEKKSIRTAPLVHLAHGLITSYNTSILAGLDLYFFELLFIFMTHGRPKGCSTKCIYLFVIDFSCLDLDFTNCSGLNMLCESNLGLIIQLFRVISSICGEMDGIHQMINTNHLLKQDLCNQ